MDHLLELLAEKAGLPSPKKIIETKVFVNHNFPDLISRQAFLASMTSDMCEEFGYDFNKLLDKWKEKYNE